MASTAPCRIIHELRGCPPQPGARAIDEPCYVCGLDWPTGLPRSSVVRTSFTNADQAGAPWSDVICEPCAAAMLGKPSKTDPPLRMHSHLYRDGSWISFGKGDADAITLTWRTLLDPPDGPWFLALADSMQLHILPWTPLVTGRGPWRVRYERDEVASDP